MEDTRTKPMPLASIGAMRAALRTWHDRAGRQLGFRETRDPYAVLVAETMLQQTQVARIATAWPAFIRAFPDPAALAAASPADALRAWSGLGYNRRAVALHRAATVIVERHGGVVPADVASLDALPGVGPYTARAVAAVAFGEPVAAVDTNVRRLVGRVFSGHGDRRDPGIPPSARRVQSDADAFLDPEQPAAWTHAAMDLGATICRPVPRCGPCPLASWCRYAGAAVRSITAAKVAPVRRAAGVPFRGTARWLRGRIVQRLRELPTGEWMEFAEPIVDHPLEAVASALAALERDGILERMVTGAVRLRLAGGPMTYDR